MKKSVKYSPEVMERAVRLVFEARAQYESHGPPLYPLRPRLVGTAEPSINGSVSMTRYRSA